MYTQTEIEGLKHAFLTEKRLYILRCPHCGCTQENSDTSLAIHFSMKEMVDMATWKCLYCGNDMKV